VRDARKDGKESRKIESAAVLADSHFGQNGQPTRPQSRWEQISGMGGNHSKTKRQRTWPWHSEAIRQKVEDRFQRRRRLGISNDVDLALLIGVGPLEKINNITTVRSKSE
jgi:hypothetical protein